MPNWKKLVVSGSDALLNSVTASNGFFGTASWARNAVTASVVTATGNQGVIAFKGSTFLTSSNNLYYNGANLVLNNGKIWQSDSNLWYTVLGATGQASATENGLFSYDSNLDNIYPVASYDQVANKYYFANYQVVYNGTNGNTGIGTTVPGAKLEVNGNVKATSFTGSLQGTSSWATNAITASFLPVGTYNITSSWAVSSSQALTASYVTTLNQNVLITGSLTIGSSSLGSNENTLVLGLPPAGGTGEGGQILLQAPGGTYTSASMWDNYQNKTRLLRGTNVSSDAEVATWNMHSKQMQLPAYNALAAFSGTPVAALGVNSNGDVITIQTGSQAGGTGVTINNNTNNYILTATGTANTIEGEANLTFNGSTLAVTGNVTATSFTGSLQGTATSATSATNATNAQNVNVKSGPGGAKWFVPLASVLDSYAQLYGTSNLQFDSTTNLLEVTSSYALSSSLISTIRTSSTSTFYPTFVDSDNSPAAYEQLLTTNNISFRPGLGTISATSVTATSFTGSLQGSASYATNAGTASITTTAQKADQISTVQTSTNANFYIPFVDSNNSPAAYEQLYTDSTGFLYHNPSTSTLYAKTYANTGGGINPITASWAVSASWAPGSSPTTPGGGDTHIQINSGSTFYGTADLTYDHLSSSQTYGQLRHRYFTDFKAAPYNNKFKSSIVPFSRANDYGQQAGITHWQFSISANTGPVDIYAFDTGLSVGTTLQMYGFKCDYSIMLFDGTDNRAARVGTLLGAWNNDNGSTPALTDTYVDGDVSLGLLGTVVFTLAWNGFDIVLQMDCTSVSSGDTYFNGVFTNFGSTV